MPPLGSLSAAYRQFIGSRGFVPPLAGPVFLNRPGSKTVAQLIARFDEITVNITAWVLQINGAKPGTRLLTRTTDVIVSSIVG
ncbi:MAG TPA: hypothetical protein VG345_04365 [Bryobacteraceae bacterium]|nr:hypothetical protein [Bryobacteraceae bacterium]